MATSREPWLKKRTYQIPVMEQLMLFIKHRLGFIWSIIEAINDIVFGVLYKTSLERILPIVFLNISQEPYLYRRLEKADVENLHNLISSQPSPDLQFFNPHPFDKPSLLDQTKKRSFLMMGVFDGEKLIGYFFLRFFANRKCFVGRIIDKNYRGKGIGSVMNTIMYETAWRMKFRCLSTISRENSKVIRAHTGNKHMVILKELSNNYLLVEFVPDREV